MTKKEIIIAAVIFITVFGIGTLILLHDVNQSQYYVEQEIVCGIDHHYTIATVIYRDYATISDLRMRIWFDDFNPNNPHSTDSIKCRRYNEAKNIANEFDRIDKQKCK